MQDFRKFQNWRIITEEGTIAHGDYIRKEEGVTIRTDESGLLNDNPDENGKPLPAIETHDGSHIEHYKHGVLHCVGGPAIIDVADNYELWFVNGKEIKPETNRGGTQ